jgi:hypothetical protein
MRNGGSCKLRRVQKNFNHYNKLKRNKKNLQELARRLFKQDLARFSKSDLWNRASTCKFIL